MIVLLVLAAFAVGLTAGFLLGVRRLPHLLATMTPAQLAGLARTVNQHRR